ncbi:LPXTG cell wall anchor domain-containing protein [Streptomyces sp. NPDC059443]
MWVFLRLPGAPENPATGYYQAAKVLAVGLVLAGSSLLSRRRRAR